METKRSEDNTAPLMCGVCSERFSELYLYYSHLKSHNIQLNKWFHICAIPDEEVEMNGDEIVYKCYQCAFQSRSVCALHDHITSCFNSGPYIFFHRKSTAYPLLKFCSFFEDREIMYSDKSVDPCLEDAGNGSAIIDGKRMADEQCENLRKLFLDMLEEGRRGSEKALCDSVIRTPNIYVKNSRNTKKKLRTRKASSAGKDSSDIAIGSPSIDVTKSGNTKSLQNRRKRKASNAQAETKLHKTKVTRSYDTQSNSFLNKIEKDINTTKEQRANGYLTRGKRKKMTKPTLKRKEKQLPPDSDLKQDSVPEADTHTCLPSNTVVVIKEEIENISDSDDENKTDKICQRDRSNNIHAWSDQGREPDRVKSHTNHVNNGNAKSSKLKSLLGKKGKDYGNSKIVLEAQLTDEKSDVVKNDDNTQEIDCAASIKNKRGRKCVGLEACQTCGKWLKRCKMKAHVISHSDVRPYKCDQCPKTYKYSDHLAKHKMSHDAVLPFYCEVCGVGFICANRLKRHTIMHTDERPFSCEICNAGFVTRYKLERHMPVHTGEKQVQCDLCGMRFAHRDNLSQHISGIHKQERRFACPDCDRKFFTNYQLKCHAMKHAGIRPFKCSLCKSDFIERKELRRHMRKLHNLSLEGKQIPGANSSSKCDKSDDQEVSQGSTGAGSSSHEATEEVVSVPLPTSVDCPAPATNLALPLFITNMNQSGALVNTENQGTSHVGSEQFQDSQHLDVAVSSEQFQTNTDGGKRQFQNFQTTKANDSGQFQTCQTSTDGGSGQFQTCQTSTDGGSGQFQTCQTSTDGGSGQFQTCQTSTDGGSGQFQTCQTSTDGGSGQFQTCQTSTDGGSGQFQTCQTSTDGGSGQFQTCQTSTDGGSGQFQTCQTSTDGGSGQFQACQPAALKIIPFDNHLGPSSRHYDMDGEQGTISYNNIAFSDTDQRVYLQPYLVHDIKQQQGYEETQIQGGAKGIEYVPMDTAETKPVQVYEQLANEQNKDQFVYQKLSSQAHGQPNFAVQ